MQFLRRPKLMDQEAQIGKMHNATLPSMHAEKDG